MDKLLSLLGLALKAGALAVGEEPVEALCRRRDCRLVMTASDAAGGSVKRAEAFAREGQCLLLPLPRTKEVLGPALGRGSAAILGLKDLGFARAVAGKLAEEDGARYGEAVRTLAKKAERRARRQQAKSK